ncbi:nucleotide sugar dehydrogenase [bacterium]|nr:nucleotide sugar dehydrogenase [bacterium]
MNNEKVYSVIGLGKLGASMAAAVASRGFQVIGVDINKKAVDLLNAGHAPVHETDLENYVAANRERLRATMSHYDAVIHSDISFVIVPTPSDKRGAFSLQYAAWAFREMSRGLKDKNSYHLVVLVSTVLPGSTRYGLLPVLEKGSGKTCGPDFGLCYSPDFIALGSIIHNYLNPDFNLVGEFDRRSGDLLGEFYSQVMLNSPPCKRMTLENAELAKVALNTFVTTKIAYANMIAEICEQIPGGDVDAVTDAIGTDSRIGKQYLKGALGYGGPCFPRDNLALSFFASRMNVKAEIAETTHRSNFQWAEKIVRRLISEIKHPATVAVLGLAYKPYSDVVEESQSLYIAQALSEAGVRVIGYDPLAGNAARNEIGDRTVILDSLRECLDQADVVLITTPDPEFKALRAEDFGDKKVVVFDFWRILEKELAGKATIRYIPVGRSVDDKTNRDRLFSLWNN